MTTGQLIDTPSTPEEFAEMVRVIQSSSTYAKPEAFGLAIVRRAEDGRVLDVRFGHTNIAENYGSHAVFWAGLKMGPVNSENAYSVMNSIVENFSPFLNDGSIHPNITGAKLIREGFQNELPGASLELVEAVDLSAPPTSAQDVWLRLTLLSQRKVKPHNLNLEGTFGLLTNVAWTSIGPMLPEAVEQMRFGEHLEVHSIDKFPRMTDYVVPSGVRIADAARVRLGAHLAEGTTVMHEGFVNFNAGTLGVSMVEGRISAGVVVGDGSDIGGGASIMGTLSGGGKEVISIGQRCLLGANSGIGISLGDDCVVEAGCYVTAGAKVDLIETGNHRVVKASELSGASGLLFRRNSQSGAIEALPREGKTVDLNPALHAN